MSCQLSSVDCPPASPSLVTARSLHAPYFIHISNSLQPGRRAPALPKRPNRGSVALHPSTRGSCKLSLCHYARLSVDDNLRVSKPPISAHFCTIFEKNQKNIVAPQPLAAEPDSDRAVSLFLICDPSMNSTQAMNHTLAERRVYAAALFLSPPGAHVASSWSQSICDCKRQLSMNSTQAELLQPPVAPSDGLLIPKSQPVSGRDRSIHTSDSLLNHLCYLSVDENLPFQNHTFLQHFCIIFEKNQKNIVAPQPLATATHPDRAVSHLLILHPSMNRPKGTSMDSLGRTSR